MIHLSPPPTRPTAPTSTDTTVATGITAGGTMAGTIRRRNKNRFLIGWRYKILLKHAFPDF